jgi:hypothetical protein
MYTRFILTASDTPPFTGAQTDAHVAVLSFLIRVCVGNAVINMARTLLQLLASSRAGTNNKNEEGPVPSSGTGPFYRLFINFK